MPASFSRLERLGLKHTCGGLPGTNCIPCAKIAAGRVKKPKPPKLSKIVMGKRVDPHGRVKYQGLDRGQAGLVMGGSKGGKQAWANGRANKFNSESARKAARRRWDRYERPWKRTGLRVGMAAKRRAAVNHAELRRHYAENPTAGIRYEGSVDGKHIWSQKIGDRIQQTTERTALVKLGHLKGRGTFIPQEIQSVQRGKKVAVQAPRVNFSGIVVGAVKVYRPGGKL